MLRRWVAGCVLITTLSMTMPAVADPGQETASSPGAASSTGIDKTTPLPQGTSVQPALATPAAVAPPPGEELPTGTPPDLLPDPDVDRLNGRYFLGFLHDTGRVLSSPLSFDRSDWLKVGMIGGITGSLFLIDSKVKNFAQSNQSSVGDKFATLGNDLGDPLYTLPPLGAFYMYGLLKDDVKARKTSLLALESFVISGVITDGIKMLVQRHRPNTGHSPGNLDGPNFSLKNLSFASGHTTSAFSIATVIANRYENNPYVPPIAYGLATLTGLSRIYSNAHWASDVFFGGAIGYFVGKAVLGFHKEKTAPSRLTLMPTVGKEMTGMTMQYTF